ncbi:hypothetical protein PMAYCL1PPCAC_13353 [Pristionchus mayeri]|uniref:F-box domain-containing protein n=1 Tax=Pristionchus mayeri TaxID=1317129 RepID=A0AAN5C9Q1_9BILA|nr:hypothetical protein PMAYCL1PPCAC_13353 [Pristionchus mayeri]
MQVDHENRGSAVSRKRQWADIEPLEYSKDLISQLPNELKWEIISLVVDSIQDINLVCKSWKLMVDDWAIPCNFTEIDKIAFREFHTRVSFDLPFDQVGCVGLQSILCTKVKEVVIGDKSIACAGSHYFDAVQGLMKDVKEIECLTFSRDTIYEANAMVLTKKLQTVF